MSFSGIGLETTILFAREGARVLMADISPKALERGIVKVREHVSQSAQLHTITCDVTKEDEIAKMVEHMDQWGGVDVMFNNAGIMHADDADGTFAIAVHPTFSQTSTRSSVQTGS